MAWYRGANSSSGGGGTPPLGNYIIVGNSVVHPITTQAQSFGVSNAKSCTALVFNAADLIGKKLVVFTENSVNNNYTVYYVASDENGVVGASSYWINTSSKSVAINNLGMENGIVCIMVQNTNNSDGGALKFQISDV